MSIVIREENLFDYGFPNVAIAIPVNREGITFSDLSLWAESASTLWRNQYREDCQHVLKSHSYSIFSVAEHTFVNIVTKDHADDDDDPELFIQALLDFDYGLFNEGMIGHGIQDLRIAFPLDSDSTLRWEEVEPLLEKALKDTKVNFHFCVASKECPSVSREVILPDRSYYFKGEHIFGLIGDYPLNAKSPFSEDKHYANALHFIYDYIQFNLMNGKDYSEENFIEEIKKDLIEYVKVSGMHLPTSLHLSQIIYDTLLQAKQIQLDTLPEFKENLLRLKELNVESCYYCGYEFPRLLGINVDLSDILQNPNYTGKNILGDLIYTLLQYTEE